MRCIFSPRSIHGSSVARYVGNWAETFDNENGQDGGTLLEVFFVRSGRWVGNRIKNKRGGGRRVRLGADAGTGLVSFGDGVVGCQDITVSTTPDVMLLYLSCLAAQYPHSLGLCDL